MNSIETNRESQSVLALFLKALKSTDFLNVPNFHETEGPDSCASTWFCLGCEIQILFPVLFISGVSMSLITAMCDPTSGVIVLMMKLECY